MLPVIRQLHGHHLTEVIYLMHSAIGDTKVLAVVYLLVHHGSVISSAGSGDKSSYFKGHFALISHVFKKLCKIRKQLVFIKGFFCFALGSILSYFSGLSLKYSK